MMQDMINALHRVQHRLGPLCLPVLLFLLAAFHLPCKRMKELRHDEDTLPQIFIANCVGAPDKLIREFRTTITEHFEVSEGFPASGAAAFQACLSACGWAWVCRATA